MNRFKYILYISILSFILAQDVSEVGKYPPKIHMSIEVQNYIIKSHKIDQELPSTIKKIKFAGRYSLDDKMYFNFIAETSDGDLNYRAEIPIKKDGAIEFEAERINKVLYMKKIDNIDIDTLDIFLDIRDNLVYSHKIINPPNGITLKIIDVKYDIEGNKIVIISSNEYENLKWQLQLPTSNGEYFLKASKIIN